MKKSFKTILSIMIVMIFLIGNFNLSYGDSKNSLDSRLYELTKVVNTVQKQGTKKVAKKQLKNVKKIENEIENMKLNERLKYIALNNAKSVKYLCENVKKDKKLSSKTKSQANNCKDEIKSTRRIIKYNKTKRINEAIRIETSWMLNDYSKKFNDKVLSTVSSGDDYDTEKLSNEAYTIISGVSELTNYFTKGNLTKYDLEITKATDNLRDSMNKFKNGKLTVGEYANKRSSTLNVCDKYSDSWVNVK